MLVVVAADTSRCLPVTVPSSIFPALQNLLLAAGAVGLGSALTTIATAFAAELRDAVGLPPSRRPGRGRARWAFPRSPSARPGASRSPQHTHRDRYGSPWTLTPDAPAVCPMPAHR